MTIKSLQNFFYLTMVLCAILCCVLVYSLLQLSKAQGAAQAANENRYRAYLLADELRQSSDDLTRLARTFVVTGDAKWEQQYNAVLDIRNGKKPRPVEYHRIYWDFLAASSEKPRPDGATTPLKLLMESAEFSAQEFQMLDDAQKTSDGLVVLEVEAMNAVNGLFRDESGKFTKYRPPDLERGRKLMHSPEYHEFKRKIMIPVDQFFVQLENRTRAAVDVAEQNVKIRKSHAFGLVCVLVVGLAAQAGFLRFRVFGSLGDLESIMGDLASNLPIGMIPGTKRSDELGRMAKSVEVFRDNRKHLEQGQLEQDRARAAAEQTRIATEAERVATAKDRRQELLSFADRFERGVGGIVKSISCTAEALLHASKQLTHAAENTVTRSERVATASEQAAGSVQRIASSTEELSVSVASIAENVAHASTISADAVTQAGTTRDTVRGLADASKEIGEILTLIKTIAIQTNLLGLNATIEATSAGEAGKGFAVVASEVKSLAVQTTTATERIRDLIDAIQTRTESAVSVMTQIAKTINKVNTINTSISAAVLQQGVAANEIARTTFEAAKSASEVSRTIIDVKKDATQTGHQAQDTQKIANALAKDAASLQTDLRQLLALLRSD